MWIFPIPNYPNCTIYIRRYHIHSMRRHGPLISKQAANVYLCDKTVIPLAMTRDDLVNQLRSRGVYFKESDTRDTLVHLLETDILLRNKGCGRERGFIHRNERCLRGLSHAESHFLWCVQRPVRQLLRSHAIGSPKEEGNQTTKVDGYGSLIYQKASWPHSDLSGCDWW